MVSNKEKERKRIYNEKNRDKINERQRLYRLNNPEKIKQQRKDFRVNHNQKLIQDSRDYYAKNKEQMNGNNKLYRQKNKEHINTQKKIYRSDNPNIMRNANKKWSENNQKKVLERQLRYIKKLGLLLKLDSSQVKPAFRTWRGCILKKDNYTCQFCGVILPKSKLEADHIKPKIDFPEMAFDLDNGRTLCKECHYKRHGKLGGV